jgi:hypothetical protein
MDKSKIKGISSIKRKPKTTRATMYMKNGSAMKNEKMMKAGSKIMTSTKTGDCGCGGKAKLQLGGKITPNPYLDAELKRKAAVAGGTIPPNTFTTSRNTRNTYSDLANARQRRASVAPLTTTAPLGAGGRDPLRTMQEDQYTIIDKVTGKLRRRLPSERKARFLPAMRAANIANRAAGRPIEGTSQLTGLPLSYGRGTNDNSLLNK